MEAILNALTDRPEVKAVKWYTEGDIPMRHSRKDAAGWRAEKDIPGVYVWMINHHGRNEMIYVGQSVFLPERMLQENTAGACGFIYNAFTEYLNCEFIPCARYQKSPALPDKGMCDCIPRLRACVVYLRDFSGRDDKCKLNELESELIRLFRPPLNNKGNEAYYNPEFFVRTSGGSTNGE